jgi:hypothetical protein
LRKRLCKRAECAALKQGRTIRHDANRAAQSTAARAEVPFRSTQVRPVEETQKMQEDVLKGLASDADYLATESGPWLTHLQADFQAGTGSIGVLGGLLVI